MSMSAKQLKHPYITTNKKIRNGEPIISGTGIRVLDIAIRYELAGMTPDDIIVALYAEALTAEEMRLKIIIIRILSVGIPSEKIY